MSSEDIKEIIWFIRSCLEREWDNYTNIYICNDRYEDGVRRMDPEMYDLATQLEGLLYNS